MNKKQLHHLWTYIRPVKTWHLAAACLLLVGFHVAALRANYSGMVERRNAVYEADKDDGDTEKALQELRAYVGNHMNTDLDQGNGVYPPIQLKYTYDRLKQAEQQRVDTINSNVYTEAQKHCEALYPNSFSGGPRVPCIQEYVKQHGTSVRSIPDAVYKFSFVSPSWSPDIAGWSLVFCILFLSLTVIRFTAGRWLHSYLR